MSRTLLCRLDEIEDGGSANRMAEIDGERLSLVVVRQGERVYTYLNICPHIGAPLDFEPGRFLTLERDLIQCAMHGALFRIEDGACVHGPCNGRGLTRVANVVEDDHVFLV